ncbi:hypothetical protein OEA41_008052 [Lepraria neglecta]|uniref:Small oligopeptide transporter n=1 Tax=Lepraria neglecta TaxID=209136 RepID=A0AAE0DNU9_9LECA|nr:hypothetical protein OEA41_008052 [Lepraria neglecta]
MSSFAKRFGFGQKPPANAANLSPESASTEDVKDIKEKDTSAVTTGADGRHFSEVEANTQLRQIKKKHRWDPNLPEELEEGIEEATDEHNLAGELRLVDELVENSPYPEVRAAVRNYDEDMPINTVRAWVLGILLTTIASGLNALFALRQPAITITSLTVQLVAYPLGVAWHRAMPSRQFRLFGRSFSLNPCPFNMKEHTIIVVMANVNVAGGVAYATDTLTAQRGFYHQNFGWGFNILLCISTQMIGYGLAGIFRKVLVWPAAMIWPTSLINTALFYGLHDQSRTDPAKTNGWSISRYRYFFIVFAGSFCWYWFPGFIAPFLSVFCFACWIRPNNVVINQLFGGWTGISLLPITFDWTQITAYAYSPLIPPWHAIANTLIGMVIFFWFTSIGVHYTNTWYSNFLPISDSQSYDNTGNLYNVTNILNSDFTLDLAAYEAYSPLFLSTTFALTYGLSFATISAVIVQTAIFHGPDLWKRIRSMRTDEEDVHYRMMRKYKDVPQWWYLSLFMAMLAISLGVCLGYPTLMHWWGFFVALIISTVWFVPIGMIQGMTSVQIGLNVFTEFITGYIQPGRPIAMMLFKTYGYITMAQGLYFTQDLKLGQYMKIPPRSMFMAQTIATVWACIVQVGVLEWALGGAIADICTEHQANKFNCPNGRVFFNASVIWGLIGPQRIFSPGSLYANLQYFWLAGILTPILFYVLARMFPRLPFKYLSAPLIFGGSGQIPPATPLNYLSWGIVGYVFNKHIRNKYRGWWMRFNYITSAGLDVGLAICTIVIILAVNLTNTHMPSWWGVSAANNNADNLDTAVRYPNPNPSAPGRFFGPTQW